MSAFEQRLLWAVRPQWLWRLLRLGLRSFWMSALVAGGGWLLTRAAGLPVPFAAWLGGGFALFMFVLPVVALWPLSLGRLARRLDRAFGLSDRLATAHEIARRAPANYLESRLLETSQRLLGRVRARLVRTPRVPWVDFELCLLALVGLYACYLLSVTAAASPPPPDLPPAAFEPLAPLTDPVQVPLPGAPPELSAGAGDGAGAPEGEALDPGAAQQALQALAEALSRQSITQPAGEALRQGDAEQAAQSLRELADQAQGLSEETRRALADSLREAAQDAADAAPGVAAAIQDSADALENADPTGALENLAQLVEALDAARQGGTAEAQETPGGADGAGQGAGSGAGSGGSTGRETQPEGSTERLLGESEVVDLPEDETPSDEDSVLQPPQPDSQGDDQRSTPYTHTGAAGSGGGPSTDPLSFPWRLRDVVQRYFSPR